MFNISRSADIPLGEPTAAFFNVYIIAGTSCSRPADQRFRRKLSIVVALKHLFDLSGSHACAALTFSWWSPFLFLFPFTAPVVRPLAAKLPDAGFRRILGARKTIRDVALRLIANHRRFLAQVLSCDHELHG